MKTKTHPQIVNLTPVPEDYLQIATAVWELTKGWLLDKYNLADDYLDDLQIQLEMKPGRNWYYPEQQIALIRLASTRLYLYNMKAANLTTPPQGLEVGVGVYMALAFIHEGTHYLQFKAGAAVSELETTRNQIDFMEEQEGLYYSLLVKATGADPEVKEASKQV